MTKSLIEPIYKSLIDVSHTADDNCSMLMQFIRTTEIDLPFIYSISNDSLLPQFIQQISKLFFTIKFDELLNTQHSELAFNIISFLTKLATSSPFLLDTTSAQIDYDMLVQTIFSNVYKNGDVRKIEPTKIAPLLKFFAILGSSREVSISCIDTMTTLYAIIVPLLNSPQVSAWSCAIIACLARQCKAFESFLKSQPNILHVKRDLTALLSSHDMIVVCSALSAHTALFSIGNEAKVSLHAAINFFSQNSAFVLMKKLSAMSILSLKEKAQLDTKELTTLLHVAIQSKGLDAYIVFDTLISLPEYYSAFSSIMQSTEYFASLLKFIARSPYDFVCVAGTQFLQTISECDAEVFMNIPGTNLYGEIFEILMSLDEKAPTEKLESILIILNSIMKYTALSQDEIALLDECENQIFTSFVRHIELGNAFLALCYYQLIQGATVYLDKWETKLELIAIETQLIPLIISVLTSSLNKCSVCDALSSLQHFIGRGTHFFEAFVSGITILNRKKADMKKDLENHHNEERRQLDREIHELNDEKTNLNNIISEQKNEIQTLKETAEERNIKFEEMRQTSEVNLIKVSNMEKSIKEFEQQVATLKSENETLSNLAGSNGVTVKRVMHENEELVQQLRLYQKTDRSKQKQIEDYDVSLRKKSEELTALKIAFENKDHELSIAQMRASEAENTTTTLKEEIQKQKALNKSLCIAAEKIRKDLIEERNRSNALSVDITTVEQQNKKLLAVQKDFIRMRDKYHKKKDELKKALAKAEQEKNKWETIAKFNQKVKECKNKAAEEVYSPLFLN